MPWRLITCIVVFGIFLAFIMFNLDNRCDINFFGAKLENVPVFITIFASFILGFSCALPVIHHIKRKKKEPHEKENKPKKEENFNPHIGSDNAI